MKRRQHSARWASRALGRSTQVREGAAWLRDREWHLLASLTFRDLPNKHAAERILIAWIRWVARAVFRGHVAYAWAGDREGLAGTHFHVLLRLPQPPTRAQVRLVQIIWALAHGFAKVERYQPHGSAATYLMQHAEWDAGVMCPRLKPDCRRTRGCRETARVWA